MIISHRITYLLTFSSLICLSLQETEKTTDEDETTTNPIFQSKESKGEVAFIIGNRGISNEVEVYSPDGKCQYALTPIPIAILPSPILMFLDEKIIACADTVYDNDKNSDNCWRFKPDENHWSAVYMNKDWESFRRYGKPGVLNEKKLYIIDDSYPEVFDFGNKTWDYWPKPINATSVGACFIHSKESFILFGGLQMGRTAQKFDLVNQTWNLLATPPMDIEYSGCTVLPNQKILVLGSDYSYYRRTAAIYDPELNTWESLGETTFDRFGTSLVVLGDRVFAIGGGYDPNVQVEEFFYNNNTWKVVEPKPKLHRLKHTSIAVPATLFRPWSNGCEGV